MELNNDLSLIAGRFHHLCIFYPIAEKGQDAVKKIYLSHPSMVVFFFQHTLTGGYEKKKLLLHTQIGGYEIKEKITAYPYWWV